jgi:chemotaxis protein CheD
MQKLGANKARMTAKIAGGAQMFNFPGSSNIMRIGERNVEATKQKLAQLGIRIIAEDTGSNYGRTIEFFPETGELLIKSVGKDRKIL